MTCIMQRATCSTPDPTLQHAASERSHLTCLLQQASSKMQRRRSRLRKPVGALQLLWNDTTVPCTLFVHRGYPQPVAGCMRLRRRRSVALACARRIHVGRCPLACPTHLVPQPQRHRVHDGVHRQADRQRRRRAARARHRPDERRDRQPVEQPDALAQCGRPRRQRVPFTPESRLHTWRPAGRRSGNKTTSNEVVWRALTSEYSYGGLSTRTGVLPSDGIALL